jgi:TolB-like protein/DNA-binding winged helix-turn-helix (wHTH) protein/Tfp pilus assembly protein PilF
VQIPPKTYDVLRYLVENPGRLVTPDELLEKLWPETYVNPELLRKYILDIRKVLGDRPDKPEFIETVTKRGYRFIAAVIDESPASGPNSASQRVNVPTVTASAEETFPRDRALPSLAIVLLITVIAIGAAADRFWSSRSAVAHSSLNTNSIAVLPLTDLSPGKDQEYFSDGLSDELITDLAKTPGLKVVARSSAFQFKGKNEDLRTVAQKLGVANVLEGSVRKEGNRTRISVELIKTDDGFQLWSETYDREVQDIFTVQDEIARAVVKALQSRLLNGDATIADASRTKNSEAYQAYLQGQYFIARGLDSEDLIKALSFADQAVKLDPHYAPAWAQQARILETMARVLLIAEADGYRRARASAERAIALDPKLASAYLTLALVQMNQDWDWESASASIEKARLLAPGSVNVLRTQAYLDRNMGRVEEAIALYRQAIVLDPLTSDFHSILADQLYGLGRYEEAKAELARAQELNSQHSSLHLIRSQILLMEGHPQEAVTEIEKETSDWQKLSGQALAYFGAGRRHDSDNALGKLIATHHNDCAYQIAQVYAYRGEADKAFEWLDRAYKQRDPGIREVTNDPLFKSVVQDPRYANLLSRMGRSL